MRIRDVITAVRDKVNDPNRKYWTDVEIARWASHHARQLFRHKAQADSSYGAVNHLMLGTDADRVRSIKDDQFRYHFPSWVYRINGVRERKDANTRATLVDVKWYPRDQISGWFLSTDRSIDLMGFTSAMDLEIEAAKLPTQLHYGTVDSPCEDRQTLRLASAPVDQDAKAFPLDLENDAYVGMEVELMTGSTETTDRRGHVQLVISQDHVYDSALSKWVVRLVVFPKWPTAPQIGDTYELHVPLDESNYEYVSARIARSLFHKTDNQEGIATVQSVMLEGHDAYIAGLRPRQDQENALLVDPENVHGGFNPDKDYSGEGFW